jgi:hypothetical protein
MNLRIKLFKDIAGDKITEADQVIMSLPTVKKYDSLTNQIILCGRKKKGHDRKCNNQRTRHGQIIINVAPKHLQW